MSPSNGLWRRLLARFDKSERIAKLLDGTSDWLAPRRGVPIMIAIALIVISFLIQIALLVIDHPIAELCGFTVLHLGILIALIGILLAEPIGRG
jgi:hypothetical protein